jgi:ribonuclease I
MQTTKSKQSSLLLEGLWPEQEEIIKLKQENFLCSRGSGLISTSRNHPS